MGKFQGCNADGVAYDGPYSPNRQRVTLDASHDGVTRQEFADECDINILMDRYERTKVLNHFNSAEPQYFDASDVPDLARALAIVAHAEDAFMTLSAKTRAEFDNDPVKFVAFAENPDNLEQMRQWGLAPPEPVAEPPMKVEVINPAPPAEASK